MWFCTTSTTNVVLLLRSHVSEPAHVDWCDPVARPSAVAKNVSCSPLTFLPVRIQQDQIASSLHRRDLCKHFAETWAARHYVACRNIPLQVYLITGEPEQDEAGEVKVTQGAV